jgi:hypothetical protein
MTKFENVGLFIRGNSLSLLAQAIFEPNLFQNKYANILDPSHSSYLPAYENGTEFSETSAYKIQAPGNYPEESIQHSEQDEFLKSRSLSYTLVGSVSHNNCIFGEIPFSDPRPSTSPIITHTLAL